MLFETGKERAETRKIRRKQAKELASKLSTKRSWQK